MRKNAEFIEAECKREWGEGTHYERESIPLWRAFQIARMASENVWPDGSFGDYECSLWEACRRG